MVIKLDLRRLLCPMPVIRLQQKMQELNIGDVVELVATDKGVKHDIPAWSRVHKHKILNIEEIDNEIIIVVEKS